jgi:hypothetical protein
MAEPDRALRIFLQKAGDLRVEVDKVNPDPPTDRLWSIWFRD